MRHLGASLLLVLAFSVSGCGEHKVERGLAPPNEEATPEAAADMKKTEHERQQEVLQEEQQKEAEEFDASEK